MILWAHLVGIYCAVTTSPWLAALAGDVFVLVVIGVCFWAALRRLDCEGDE